jgi:hypothetical protein
MADRGQPWVTLGSFESVRAAAQKIIELEAYLVSGVFFEALIETKAGSDENAFSHLEHAGANSRSYVIKRARR